MFTYMFPNVMILYSRGQWYLRFYIFSVVLIPGNYSAPHGMSRWHPVPPSFAMNFAMNFRQQTSYFWHDDEGICSRTMYLQRAQKYKKFIFNMLDTLFNYVLTL